MLKEKAKEIRKWETRLKPAQTDETNVEVVTMSMYKTWIITDFGRNLKGEFVYIIQPLVNPSGMGEGVTGMSVFVLNEEELLKYFEIIE